MHNAIILDGFSENFLVLSVSVTLDVEIFQAEPSL